jgi:type VI secretion system secreted protein VgrG
MAQELAFALAVGRLSPRHLPVNRVQGREAISGSYHFDVTVATAIAEDHFEELVLGRSALLLMRMGDKKRCVSGIVSAFQVEGAARTDQRWTIYRIRIVPRAWLLGKRKGSRVFQRLRIDQIIDAVAAQVGVRTQWHLSEQLPERAFCTQYEETDLAFVERLCAENGVWHRFHPPSVALEALISALDAPASTPLPLGDPTGLAEMLSSHNAETWVFSNAAHYPPIGDGDVTAIGDVVPGSDALAPSPTLRVREADALRAPGRDDWVMEASFQRAIRATRGIYREYDPSRPLARLEAFASAFRDEAANEAETSPVTEPTDLAIYEHDGHDLYPDWSRGTGEPARILTQRRRRGRVLQGQSACPRLEAGRRFALEDHPVGLLNQSYAIVEVHHDGVSGVSEVEAPGYHNRFVAVPSDVAYVPPRPERRSVQVCLTALVVGPPGEEIHVNDRGEIKVKFHWDRSTDEHDSSCWLRTMQPWAGAGWGFQFIPRVGMEVVVVFEGGDPDKPLVLGSVYNGATAPAFALPAQKTKSGIVTRSTPGIEGRNELSFEDAAGAERIFVRAERDHVTLVQHDRRATVQHDDETQVAGDHRLDVTGAQRVEVTKNRDTSIHADDHLRVGGARISSIGADREEIVGRDRRTHVAGNDRLEVQGEAERIFHRDVVHRIEGNATTIVGRNDAQRSCTVVVEGPAQLTAEKAVDFASEEELVLRCGHSFIRIAAGEIEIGAARVTIRGEDARLLLAEGEAKLKVQNTFQAVSDDSVVLTSSGASLGLRSEAQLDGSRVLLNSPDRVSDEIEVDEPELTHIELVDQEGQPIAYQRFRIVFDDGSEFMGFLDEEGKATVDVEGSGHIDFPDLANIEEA